MRKLIPCALILASTALHSDDYWCLDHRVRISIDYGHIRRQGVRDLRLVQEDAVLMERKKGLVPIKVMDTDDLAKRFGWEPAIRGGVTFNGTACSSVEFLYTYFHPWTAKKTVTGTALQFPFLDPTETVDYRMASKVETEYKSQLHNGEASYWGHVTPQRVDYFSFSWNLGARIMYLKEKMGLLFFRETDKSLYSVETTNNLYGPQLGAMLEINPTCRWTWTFMVKGAGFFNVVQNDVCVRDRNNTVQIIDYKKESWTDSWLLEGYGQLAWHWSSFFSIHIGYQGYILTGVALAPNNRDVHETQRRHLNDKGQITIDGFYAGLDLSF